MSQAASDLIQSRTDRQVTQSTRRKMAAALIGAGVRDSRIGL
jgi:hypothetical protein